MVESAEPAWDDGFAVRRVDSGAEVVLQLIGELDSAGIGHFNEAARDLPAHGHVKLDLSELAFMDSSGLRVLMSLDLRSRAEHWTLTLHAPQPQILKILKLCGFEQRFEITQ